MPRLIFAFTAIFLAFIKCAYSYTINEKFEAYGLLWGIYGSPSYIANECSRLYPSLSVLASSTKRDFLNRNHQTFVRVEQKMINLTRLDRGLSEAQFRELMHSIRPDMDREIIVAMQKYTASKEICTAALHGINKGKMDLNIKAKNQISIIFN